MVLVHCVCIEWFEMGEISDLSLWFSWNVLAIPFSDLKWAWSWILPCDFHAMLCTVNLYMVWHRRAVLWGLSVLLHWHSLMWNGWIYFTLWFSCYACCMLTFADCALTLLLCLSLGYMHAIVMKWACFTLLHEALCIFIVWCGNALN